MAAAAAVQAEGWGRTAGAAAAAAGDLPMKGGAFLFGILFLTRTHLCLEDSTLHLSIYPIPEGRKEVCGRG